MVNALVIYYNGVKPTKEQIVRLGTLLENPAFQFCDNVSQISHVDSESMSKLIIQKTVSTDDVTENKKENIILSISEPPSKLHLIKAIKEYLHLGLKEAKDMVDALTIKVDSNTNISDFVRIVLENGSVITSGPKEYVIQQALYLLNSYAENQWDFVQKLEKIHNGADDNVSRAIKNAIEIMRSCEGQKYMSELKRDIRVLIQMV